MELLLKQYLSIWLVNFEFIAGSDGIPRPVCMVAMEHRSHRTIRLWNDEMSGMKQTPFPVDDSSLYVSYYATADLGCHQALGWDLPSALIDLYQLYRDDNNGMRPANLYRALLRYGVNEPSIAHDHNIRHMIMVDNDEYDEEIQSQTLYLCKRKVKAMEMLLPHLSPKNTRTLRAALRHGLDLQIISKMQHRGVPINNGPLKILRTWYPVAHPSIRKRLVKDVDSKYGVYDVMTFDIRRFNDYLVHQGILDWPRTEFGQLSLNDNVFSHMTRIYPELFELHELRVTLKHLPKIDLYLGSDGRSRDCPSPLRIDEPYSPRFVLGSTLWMQHLVRSRFNMSILYADWSDMELGIAAVLSGDEKMQDHYFSPDLYKMAFITGDGGVDSDSSGKIKIAQNDIKTVLLGMLHGLSNMALAYRTGRTEPEIRCLTHNLKKQFPRYCEWVHDNCIRAYAYNATYKGLDWAGYLGADLTPDAACIFPVQAARMDIMRHSRLLLDNAGFSMLGPTNDSILIELRIRDFDCASKNIRTLMAEASANVLGGFPLKIQTELLVEPKSQTQNGRRYLWETIWRTMYENKRALNVYSKDGTYDS